MSAPSCPPPRPAKTRIAYLLADGGIGFTDSRKGSSIHARSMCRAFIQDGCQVKVFVLRKGDQAAKEFDLEMVRQGRLTRWFFKHLLERRRLRRWIPSARAESAPNWLVALGLFLWQRDFFRAALRQCLKQRPDMIYARHAWLAFPYAKLKKALGVPLVLEVNAVLTIEKASRKEIAFEGLSKRIERRLFQAADLILPVSGEIKDQIVSFGIDPDKVVVTPNAVDLDLFHPGAHSNGHSSDGFLIGAVNSFKAYHGMETLLHAAARLKGTIPGLRLRLIGKGKALPRMRELARELKIDDIAEFTGVIDHDRVPDLLRECAVCVAPYQGPHNHYNCPMKLYEYMGLKVPVVASAWGDIPNIVRHGETALLHREADPAALADCILEVYRDPEAARQRTEAAFGLAERHTWRATVSNIFSWFWEHPNG